MKLGKQKENFEAEKTTVITTVKLDPEQLRKLVELVIYVKNNKLVYPQPPLGNIHVTTVDELLFQFGLI